MGGGRWGEGRKWERSGWGWVGRRGRGGGEGMGFSGKERGAEVG